MSCICTLDLLVDDRLERLSFLPVRHVRVVHIRPPPHSTGLSYDPLPSAKPLPQFWLVSVLGGKSALGWCLLVEGVLAIAAGEF